MLILTGGLLHTAVLSAQCLDGAGSEECYCSDPCDTADDCKEGMVCARQTQLQCPDDLETGCRDGESDGDCAARAKALQQSECNAVDVKRCDFYWSVRCEVDADCGDEHLECRPGQGCQPKIASCVTDADCAAMWSCLDGGGFCMEDSEEHGECVDGRFTSRECFPAPYCGTDDQAIGPASAAGNDNSNDEVDDGSDQGENDASGCSLASAPTRSGLTWVFGLGVLLLGAMRRRASCRTAGAADTPG